MTVTCVDCPAAWTIEDSALPAALHEGYVREHMGAYGTKMYFGICDACQAKHRRAAPRPSISNELAMLRELVAKVRIAHPDWTLDQCSHEAVEILNDPRREPNLAFRAFLLHRDA